MPVVQDAPQRKNEETWTLDEDINHCEHAGRCTTLTIWQQLKDAIDNVVDNTTLADLIEEQKNMPDANLM